MEWPKGKSGAVRCSVTSPIHRKGYASKGLRGQEYSVEGRFLCLVPCHLDVIMVGPMAVARRLVEQVYRYNVNVWDFLPESSVEDLYVLCACDNSVLLRLFRFQYTHGFACSAGVGLTQCASGARTHTHTHTHVWGVLCADKGMMLPFPVVACLH